MSETVKALEYIARGGDPSSDWFESDAIEAAKKALSMIAELRAALAKAEAERDAARGALETSDLTLRDAARAVWGNATTFGRDTPHLLVAEILPLRVQVAEAQSERDALKARAERAEAAWGRLAKAIRTYDRETEVVRKYDWNSTVYAIARDARIAARAAVDAARDLEGPR